MRRENEPNTARGKPLLKTAFEKMECKTCTSGEICCEEEVEQNKKKT
jgi:hypothetical protein